MVKAMEGEEEDDPPKRPKLNARIFFDDDGKGLEQLLSAKSKVIFTKLKLPDDFFCQDPHEWPQFQSFQAASNLVRYLAVVNDRAERGVALIQDFNKKLTTNEEQLQFLHQVVTEHRKKFPDCKESTLLN